MRLYSTNEACKILGVHRNTLLEWEKHKKIPDAARNPKNNYRVYTYADLIKIAQLTGIEYINKEE